MYSACNLSASYDVKKHFKTHFGTIKTLSINRRIILNIVIPLCETGVVSLCQYRRRPLQKDWRPSLQISARKGKENTARHGHHVVNPQLKN